jgi:ATP/maltotriose-dependent transcriptional regulator MalT
MTSRADSPLPLPRFRARNQLNELRADDLRFTSEEAATFLNKAMGHALAGQDFECAARLIEVSSATMINQEETNTLLTWLDALPVEMVRSRPRLAIAKAWATVSQDRMQEAEECAADAERWALHEEPFNAETHSILGEAAAVRATMAVLLDDAPAIVDAVRKTLCTKLWRQHK